MRQAVARRLNAEKRLPRLLPALWELFSADRELALYFGFFFAIGAVFVAAIPVCCIKDGSFDWIPFLRLYFLFVFVVTALQLMLAYTHKERHFDRNATPVSSFVFAFKKFPALLLVAVIRWLLDGLMVTAVVLGASGLSGLRSKNLIGIVLGALLFAVAVVLFYLLDNLIGVLIRFGIPTIAYFEDKPFAEIPRLASSIFERNSRDAFLVEFNAEWLILAVVVGLLIALPVMDSIDGKLSATSVTASVGVLIVLIYFVKMAFTVVYCEFVSGAKAVRERKG